MSHQATNWVWSLEDLKDATTKLVLLKHADHAHDDGTHTWQSTKRIAGYAMCSERTAQRANAWLLENGYLREGDQSVIPDHYEKRRRPIAYELAMNEDTRLEWKAAAAAGANQIREAAHAAGKKGIEKRNENEAAAKPQVSTGDNLSPHNSQSNEPDLTGDNLSPVAGDDFWAVTGDTQGQSGVTDQAVTGDTAVTQTTQEPSYPSGTVPSSAAPASPPPAAPAAQGDSPTGSSKKGTRIPDDFMVTADMVTWAREKVPMVDGRLETEKFIDHWRAKPGKDGVKLDWIGTWRNWMRNAQQRLETSAATPRRGYDDKDRWGEPPAPGRPVEPDPAELDIIFGGKRNRPGQQRAQGTA